MNRPGEWCGYQGRSMAKMERLFIVLVLVAACLATLPVGRMARRIKTDIKKAKVPYVPSNEDVTEADRLFKECEKRAQSGKLYSARDYVVDCRTLIPFLHDKKLWDLMHGRIAVLHDISRGQYDAKYRQDLVQANWKWQDEWNSAVAELGYPGTPPGGLISTVDWPKVGRSVGLWYLKCVFFAFIIILIRVKYHPDFKVKEELLLRPVEVSLWSIFWPLGFMFYPDGMGARKCRYERLLSSYRYAMGYGWRDKLRPEEEEMIRRQADHRIDNFDKLVADLTQVPLEQVQRQSRVAAFVALALSIFFVPVSQAKRPEGSRAGSAGVKSGLVCGKPPVRENLPGAEKRVDVKAGGKAIASGHGESAPCPVAILPLVEEISPLGWEPCIEESYVRPPPDPLLRMDHVPDNVLVCPICFKLVVWQTRIFRALQKIYLEEEHEYQQNHRRARRGHRLGLRHLLCANVG